jgi:hemolysin activation/secretion protein
MPRPILAGLRARPILRLTAPLCLAVLARAACAQAVAAPDAGTLLRQLQPDSLPPASSTVDLPALDVARPAAPAHRADGPRFEVKAFRIAGLPAERAAALQPLLAARLGPGRTLADLEDAAKDLEVALQREGLFLAQVCVPAQSVDGGVVVLQVYEGRLGDVKLDVDPGVHVSRDYLEQVIAPLRGHPVIERGLVERVLLTLGDLRGIAATSALAPGREIGTADLTIHVEARRNDGVEAEFDNAGSVYTGRPRYYGNLDWFNLADRGDDLSLRTQFSSGSQYFHLGWLTPVDADGDRVGVQTSYLVYHLGTPLFYPLDAEGDASTWGVMALHPAIRSRNENLFLQATLETRYFDDKVHAVDEDDKKGVTIYASLGATGDFRDTWGGGGISNWSTQLVLGHLSLDTPSEAALDAQTYRSAGDYAKVVVNATRLQSLGKRDALYLSGQLQLASKNLDSSEKFNVGGLYGLRGYPSPEAPSDEALVGTWEWRRPFAVPSVPEHFVFSTFGDYGLMRQHTTPLPTDTGNMRRLVDHGVALTCSDDAGLVLRLSVAMRGKTPAQSDDEHTRVLFQASKAF